MRPWMSGLVVFAFFSGTGLASDPAGKANAPTGDWQMIKAQLGGKELAPEVVKALKLSLTGDKYVATAESKDEGTVKYLPDTSPPAMVITGTAGPNKGKTFPAIYEFHGDTLKICYDLSGKARPTEFKSKPGTQLFLATYQRIKP